MNMDPAILSCLRAHRWATSAEIAALLGMSVRHVSRHLMRGWIAQEVARKGPAPFRWSVSEDALMSADEHPAPPCPVIASKARADARRQAEFVEMVRVRPGITAGRAATILGCNDRVIRERALKAVRAGLVRCGIGSDGRRSHRYFVVG